MPFGEFLQVQKERRSTTCFFAYSLIFTKQHLYVPYGLICFVLVCPLPSLPLVPSLVTVGTEKKKWLHERMTVVLVATSTGRLVSLETSSPNAFNENDI